MLGYALHPKSPPREGQASSFLCSGLSIRKPLAHVPPKNRGRIYDSATGSRLRLGRRTNLPRHFLLSLRATFPPLRCANMVCLPYPLPHKYPFPYKLSPVPLEVVGKSLDYWMRAVSVYQLRCTNFFAHRVDDANLNHCICFHMFYV
jgi:hypothetical protein